MSELALTIACSRQRTRCPFVCSSLRSLYRTQMVNTCTAADAGVQAVEKLYRKAKNGVILIN